MAKQTKLYIAEIPPVSHEYARHIDRAFPLIEVKPGVTQEELQYNAGQRKVIDYILRSAQDTIVSGDPKDIKDDTKPSLLSKFINRIT